METFRIRTLLARVRSPRQRTTANGLRCGRCLWLGLGSFRTRMTCAYADQSGLMSDTIFVFSSSLIRFIINIVLVLLKEQYGMSTFEKTAVSSSALGGAFWFVTSHCYLYYELFDTLLSRHLLQWHAAVRISGRQGTAQLDTPLSHTHSILNIITLLRLEGGKGLFSQYRWSLSVQPRALHLSQRQSPRYSCLYVYFKYFWA